MTSISDRCKTAREAASPGRWEAKEESHTENETGAHSLEEWVEADGRRLFGNENDSVLLDYPGNLPLAALAPEAADEVIRLTEAFETLAADLDGNGYDLSEIAADIRRILNLNGAADDVDHP